MSERAVSRIRWLPSRTASAYRDGRFVARLPLAGKWGGAGKNRVPIRTTRCGVSRNSSAEPSFGIRTLRRNSDAPAGIRAQVLRVNRYINGVICSSPSRLSASPLIDPHPASCEFMRWIMLNNPLKRVNSFRRRLTEKHGVGVDNEAGMLD